MDAIERAIRSAFEKGDAEDRAFRERVYRKAFAALDRGIQANPGLTVEQAIKRRKMLQAKITEIESEFIPASTALDEEFDIGAEPGLVAVAAPSLDTVSAPEPLVEVGGADAGPALEVAAAPEPDIGGTPTLLDVPAVGLDAREESPGVQLGVNATGARATAMRLDATDGRARRRRRPVAIAFIAATLVALTAIGGWWGVQTGLFQSAEERDTSVPNPPKTVGGEDFNPEDEELPVLSSATEAQRNWISVFTPASTAQMSVPADATAEAMQDASGSFLRVRSGATGSTVVFDVGRGILEQASGKTATFDIVARAEDGKETQMAVDCNFGELGDCGRKRYAVGYERGDYLFEIAFPQKTPGAGGTIAINSDFAKAGKAVDIYEIKLSIAP